MEKNAKVATTTVTQTANEILGTAAKNLHYLIIETEKGKHIVNIGEKTEKSVRELITEKIKGGK